MSIHGSVREGDWARLFVPVTVLLASVAACSVMPPADAGTPSACRPGSAERWVGRAASAEIVEQARQASGSQSVNLVMPEETIAARVQVDRLNLHLDDRSIITRTTCG